MPKKKKRLNKTRNRIAINNVLKLLSMLNISKSLWYWLTEMIYIGVLFALVCLCVLYPSSASICCVLWFMYLFSMVYVSLLCIFSVVHVLCLCFLSVFSVCKVSALCGLCSISVVWICTYVYVGVICSVLCVLSSVFYDSFLWSVFCVCGLSLSEIISQAT